jgi:hypothetical protein
MPGETGIGGSAMSRRGRIMFAFALTIIAGILGWGWWVNFHQKTYEARLIVQSRHGELDQIERIAATNRHSCRWMTDGYPSHPYRSVRPHVSASVRDMEDSRKILALASSLGNGSLEIDCEENAKTPPIVRVWLFDAGLMPWSKPVYAFSAPAARGLREQTPGGGFISEAQGCDPVKGTQWYVCEGRWAMS